MAIAGAVLCVLRARFFRLLVLRFGTAIVWSEKDKNRATQRCSHAQGPRFNSAPHMGQSPLQSSRHNA